MVNEDIITSLKNAVDRGESLRSAMQIMISSGYNPKDVEEASRFVGGGVINELQPKPNEELIMPEKKGFMSSIFKTKNQPAQQLQSPKINQQNTGNQPQLPNLNSQNYNPKPSAPPALPNDPKPVQNTQQNTQNPVAPPQTQLTTPVNNQNNQPPALPNDPKPPQETRQTFFSHSNQQVTSQGPQSLSSELNRIKPSKQSRTKEIVLLVILLSLVGILILTIIFRNQIIGLFS